MPNEAPRSQPSAFVIIPFSSTAADFYADVLRQRSTRAGYSVGRAEDVSDQPDSLRDALTRADRADLIVVDASSPTAGTMYLLGLPTASAALPAPAAAAIPHASSQRLDSILASIRRLRETATTFSDDLQQQQELIREISPRASIRPTRTADCPQRCHPYDGQLCLEHRSRTARAARGLGRSCSRAQAI